MITLEALRDMTGCCPDFSAQAGPRGVVETHSFGCPTVERDGEDRWFGCSDAEIAIWQEHERLELPEDKRAVLCSISFGAGKPVSNPALATGMHRVAWSASEGQALNLADWAVRHGYAFGNPADGYRLTATGRQIIGA